MTQTQQISQVCSATSPDPLEISDQQCQTLEPQVDGKTTQTKSIHFKNAETMFDNTICKETMIQTENVESKDAKT